MLPYCTRNQSQTRYGQETQLTSLFYLFVRVYADLCTVKTMNVWYNEEIVYQRCLSEAVDRTVEILISKISIDLCLVKATQHKIATHYKRFEVCRVSRKCLDLLCRNEL